MNMFEKINFFKNKENKMLEKIKDSAKIVALLSAFSLPTTEIVAQENISKEGEIYSVEINKETLKKIKEKLIEINKEAKEVLNNNEVVSNENLDYKIIMSKNNDKFSLIFDRDGKLTIFDKNSDGEIDQVIMKETGGIDEESVLKNILILESSSEELLEQAAIVDNTAMEMNEKVIRFNKGKGETTCLDLKEGKGGTISWEESKNLYESAQKIYFNKLQEISKNL